MKNIKKLMIICLLAITMSPMSAQNPPPPPSGGHNQQGNSTNGGGAPIGGGLVVMLTLVLAYGGKKLYDRVYERESLEE